jgi:hypothetical protein
MKKNYRSLSNTILRLALAALLLYVATPAIQAQDQGRHPRAGVQAEVTIARGEMRFRSPTRVTGMRLEVSNQSGESVFDSGETTDHLLAWPISDQTGKPLASGLYAYTLTLKTEGEVMPHRQRGYLIVDLAEGRSSEGDRFWVTSRNAVAADAEAGEVVVAGSDETTVAGVHTKDDIGSGGSQQTAGQGGSSKSYRKEMGSPFTALSTGTAGQIAKWINSTDLGDSVITETGGGLVGIGTATPGSKLSVAGSIDAEVDYRIGGIRVFRITNPGAGLFVGPGAGFNNTTGSFLTIVGSSAGTSNTTGNLNTFLGYGSGSANTEGGLNTFLGANAGDSNLKGNENTFVGFNSDLGPTTLSGSSGVVNATAIGARATVSQSNSLVLGSIAGVNGATATVNVGIGTNFPRARLDVRSGNIYIGSPGQGLILRSPNGSICRILTVNNFGNLVSTTTACF